MASRRDSKFWRESTHETPLILVAILGFFVPAIHVSLFTVSQYHVCLRAFRSCLGSPLLVASVATALVFAVNSLIQSICQEDRLFPERQIPIQERKMKKNLSFYEARPYSNRRLVAGSFVSFGCEA